MMFRGKYNFLSNFYSIKIQILSEQSDLLNVPVSMVFNSVEHAFQASKSEKYNLFLNCTAKEAKQLGRKLPLRDDWNIIKVDIMKELLQIKFSNFALRKKLNMIDEDIIEHNYWHDNFWGVCLCEKCNGELGVNMLGNLLMKVRGER